MISGTKRNRCEPQTAPPPSPSEGPITTISPEILESILIFTNESENTLLVSRNWNVLTLTAAQNSDKYELKQTIQLITEKLNPDTHHQCIADLAEFQNVHQFLSGYAATCADVRRLFLIVKGLVTGVLTKLSEEERNSLQIGEELPDSMKDLFEISKLDLMLVENVDIDTFFTLLQSCQPLSISDRGWAIFHAIYLCNIEFAKLLLANGPISKKHRGLAVYDAAEINNPELVRLLLANGPISENHREDAIEKAAENNNPEIVQLLRKRFIYPNLA